MKTIEQLKQIWNKDKEYFKNYERGGLQTFVAEVFKCSEIFNLKQGYESTNIKSRKKEFTIEKNNKGRRADIVIFYKADEIIIPVEVERYGNIQAGIKQLANYQNDYQKAYGILTDGYTWRFYNNTIYKQFTLDDLLDNTQTFLTFWKEYIQEDNYYLNFFEKTGQLELGFIEETLKIEENRELFFEDITKLVSKFKDKLGIIGYLSKKEVKDSDKKATEISYAYLIQFILYKNLVDNYYGEFNKEFSQRLKTIHKSLKDKNYRPITVDIFSISEFISENLYKPFSKEQEFITNKLNELIRKPESEVMFEEITLWLDIIIFIKKYNFANMKNEIFGYIYENYLKELYEETNKGQYFTDPAVVNFMLDEIGYTKEQIKTLYKKKQLNKLSIIDPSCGSGTFLYSAVHRIVDALFDGTEKSAKEIEDIINNNVFGLDIAEFPLYLAEMNILMRMLPIIINEKYNNPIDKKIKIFKTQDSIAEFMDTGIIGKTNSSMDENTGQMFLFEPQILELSYKSYIRDEDDLQEMKQSMRPPRRRFDFVIGNPPYIGYNECCKQNILFTELIRQKKISMANIYGVNLNTVSGRIKTYSPKPNLYSFFIALGSGLLKPNGKMCYIIPQTILNANDLDVLRYYLSKETTILKIINFPEPMFMGRGIKCKKKIATSSLIFVIKKQIPPKEHKTEIINYTKTEETDIEKILNCRSNKKTKKEIKQQILFDKFDNWNFITKTQEEIDFIDNYIRNSISIEDYRKTLKDYDLLQFDKGFVFDKKNENKESNGYQIVDTSEKIKATLTKSYISKDFLKIPSGSQGFKIYDNKYKIVASYTRLKYYYSSENIMVRSNWIIISSNDKAEILYLLSLLNNDINKKIITYYAKSENEKILIASIKTIKNFVRIPKIDKDTEFIKKEIIEQTQKMLDLENFILSDFIDFSNITIQKFDSYEIKDNNLILTKNQQEYKLKIKDLSKIDSIKETLNNKYSTLSEQINLSDLKNIPILDKQEQQSIKDYIDDLVFALYFNIPITKVDINKPNAIKDKCSQNNFYKIL